MKSFCPDENEAWTKNKDFGRMKVKNVELIASYWTIAGGAIPHEGPEYSAYSFRDRVEMCAKVGFKGLGLWHADVENTLKSHSHQDMKMILDDNGIKYTELEFIIDWFSEGEPRKESDRRRGLLMETAEKLGARHIKIGNFIDNPCPMDRLVEEFSTICSQAAEHGTNIVFELIPWVTPGTLEDSLTMVSTADAPNGGIILDIWHIVSLQISNTEIERLPLKYVKGVELNDGPAILENDGNWVDKTVNHRQLCGNGGFDIKGFIKALDNLGYDGPVGLEVLNREMRDNWSLDELVTKSFETTMAMF